MVIKIAMLEIYYVASLIYIEQHQLHKLAATVYIHPFSIPNGKWVNVALFHSIFQSSRDTLLDIILTEDHQRLPKQNLNALMIYQSYKGIS